MISLNSQRASLRHPSGVIVSSQLTPITRLENIRYNRHPHDVLAVRIRQNIATLREKRGFSRAKLGQLMTPQTSRQQIEKLETGLRPLTVDWIERIAIALDVDPAALVAGESGEFILTEQVADEVARTLGRVVLKGAEPDRATRQVLALMTIELFDMFVRHPATRSDPQALRPAIDFLTRQHGKPAS